MKPRTTPGTTSGEKGENPLLGLRGSNSTLYALGRCSPRGRSPAVLTIDLTACSPPRREQRGSVPKSPAVAQLLLRYNFDSSGLLTHCRLQGLVAFRAGFSCEMQPQRFRQTLFQISQHSGARLGDRRVGLVATRRSRPAAFFHETALHIRRHFLEFDKIIGRVR